MKQQEKPTKNNNHAQITNDVITSQPKETKPDKDDTLTHPHQNPLDIYNKIP